MSESRILASVGGVNITEAEVTEAILSMGERGRSLMNPEGQRMVLEQLINRKLLLAGARKDLLEFDPEFKRQLALAKEELLTKFAISRAIEGVKVTDEEARKFYDENADQFNAGETVNASHILVESAEKAEEIRKENPNGREVICDSAEPKSIAEMREYGIMAVGARKGPDSVYYGIKWLQDLEEIIIDPKRCPETAREFSGYEYEEDGRGGWKAVFPDRENHAIDAVRYSRENDMRHIRVR